jgi:chromosome segregation ATPase
LEFLRGSSARLTSLVARLQVNDAHTSTDSDTEIKESDLDDSIDQMETSIHLVHSKLDFITLENSRLSQQVTSLSAGLIDEQQRCQVLEGDLTQSVGQVAQLQEKIASDAAVVRQYVTGLLNLVKPTQSYPPEQCDDVLALLSALQAEVNSMISSHHDLSRQVNDLLVSSNEEKALSAQKTAEMEEMKSKYAAESAAASSNNADITALSQSLSEMDAAITAVTSENNLLRKQLEELIEAQKVLSAQLQEKSTYIDTLKEKVQATVASFKKDIQGSAIYKHNYIHSYLHTYIHRF